MELLRHSFVVSYQTSYGVSRPKGSHGLWEDINQPLVGWNKFPLRPIRFEKEKTRWKEFPSGKEESNSK